MKFNFSVTADMVRAEASRRIEAPHKYPIWRQLNIVAAVVPGERKGKATSDYEAMRLYIDAVRAASNKLEASRPSDYKDDRHWPV